MAARLDVVRLLRRSLRFEVHQRADAKGDLVNAPLQIRPRPPYQRSKPVRDRAYLAFIRCLPCIGCLKTWGVQAMHSGPHGLGQKASDLDTLPGCPRCHEAYDANPRQFAERHQLDIPALIRRFNEFYVRVKGRAA